MPSTRGTRKSSRRKTRDADDDDDLFSPTESESMQIDEQEDEHEELEEVEEEEEVNVKGKGPMKVDEAQLENGKTLIEFMQNLEDYQPIIPDAVLDHYLTKSGFDCPDIRIKRFLALTAQKFITDVAQDAYQYCKIRQQGMSAKDKKAASKKNVLSVEDLSSALNEYGVNARRPDYYT